MQEDNKVCYDARNSIIKGADRTREMVGLTDEEGQPHYTLRLHP